jgi:ABC-type nitrate/sulfonate/bicarbonate transport system substrate-binding protein
MKQLFSLIIIWGIVVGVNVAAYKSLFPDNSVADARGAGQAPAPKDRDTQPAKPPMLALDAFSGYAIFRDPEFSRRLKDNYGIDFTWGDDGANYEKRLQALMSGETPMAVFTIDALIEQTAKLPQQPADPPATIVMFIDETRGADAMLAPQGSLIKNIDDLNHRDTKVVLVGASPSETLLRVVRSQFDLSKLPPIKKDYLDSKDKPSDVIGELAKIRPGSRTALVLWEPYVTKAKDSGAKVLIDSSRFKGYIVDVLVVQREYLKKNPGNVRAVVKTYLEMLHEFASQQDGMANLLVADSKITDEKLTLEESRQVVKGIWWKNTVENYAHFQASVDYKNLQPVKTMIDNITKVLSQTSEDRQDVIVKRPDKLFDDDIIQGLLNDKFMVGKETMRLPDGAPAISDAQWDNLVSVGSLKAPDFRFRDGKPALATPEPDEEAAQEAFFGQIVNLPNYYFRIEGNTKKEGDPEANRNLAEQRAETIKKVLMSKGIEDHRIKTKAMPPGEGTKAHIVVLQAP